MMKKDQPLSPNCKIILVDDHPLYREGIKLLIEMEHIGEVIAEAGNGKEFLDLLEYQVPDMVIMDIDMPIVDGLQATQKALELHPDIKILILSMHGDNKYYTRFIDAGAKGFILKTAGKEELENAIQKIINGESYFSQDLLLTIIHDLKVPNQISKLELSLDLNDREKEMLQLLCKGLSIVEIADIIHLSPKTIEGYRTKLLIKTETKNTLGLVLFAIKNKLVTEF
ncbi:MAG: response regulator transcription factor [Salinivirgaceae bacterium]|jgi:DNA-binding NarL/FixJ family response regulator